MVFSTRVLLQENFYVFMFAMLTVGCERALEPDIARPVREQIERVRAGKQNSILLCDTKETDKFLREIADNAPSVRSIGFSSTDLSDEGLMTLAGLPNLVEVELEFHPRITAEGVKVFGKSKSICRVVYHGSLDEISTALDAMGLLVKSP